jgi:hypothetical protein
MWKHQEKDTNKKVFLQLALALSFRQINQPEWPATSFYLLVFPIFVCDT